MQVGSVMKLVVNVYFLVCNLSPQQNRCFRSIWKILLLTLLPGAAVVPCEHQRNKLYSMEVSSCMCWTLFPVCYPTDKHSAINFAIRKCSICNPPPPQCFSKVISSCLNPVTERRRFYLKHVY